ncbi:hypothetical protein [Streptomyces somaliensis]|nr:hypothetical protein [Streptomyces somaliensis]
MIRNAIGAVLAAAGATAAVWSVFRAWYDGRPGRYVEIGDLFGGITSGRADPWTSLLLPMAFAALLTLVGLLLRSRPAVALAGVVVLGATVLWMVRQGQAAGSLTVGDGREGVGPGVGLALGGGLLLPLAAAVMAGRRRPGRRRRRGPAPEPVGPPYQGHQDHQGHDGYRNHHGHQDHDGYQDRPDHHGRYQDHPDHPDHPGRPVDPYGQQPYGPDPYGQRPPGRYEDPYGHGEHGHRDHPGDPYGHWGQGHRGHPEDPYAQDTDPYRNPPGRGDHPDDHRH